MPKTLRRHEADVARRFARLYGGRSPLDLVPPAVADHAGNFLVNTPLFLLPGQINLQAKHRVLEVGCGRGANLAFLTARFAFDQPPVGLDICQAPLAEAEAGAGGRVRYVRGTASRLPFADASFDLILSGHTIRHLSDEGLMRLLFEGQRVLRPGGLIALWDFAPTSSVRLNRWNARVLAAFGGAGTLRGFGKLAHDASETGYVVIERPRLRPFLWPPIPRTALLAKTAG